MAKVYLDGDGDTYVVLSDGRSFFTHSMSGGPMLERWISEPGFGYHQDLDDLAFVCKISENRAWEMREKGLSAAQVRAEDTTFLYCAVFAQVWAARVAEGESDDGAATEADALARRAVESHARIGGRK